MDTFLEYLVQKKPTGLDVLKKIGFILLATLVSLIVIVIFNFTQLSQFIGSFSLLLVVGAFYGAYILIRNSNLEFEYIFTNGDLDIDKIKGRQTRKRLTSLSCKNIECMAKLDDPMYAAEFKNQSIETKFDAVYDPAAGNVYAVLYRAKEKQCLLTFQPPEKLVEAMKKFNPRNVHDGNANH